MYSNSLFGYLYDQYVRLFDPVALNHGPPMDHLIHTNHMVFIIYFSPFTWGTHHFSAFASSIQFSHKNGTVLINSHMLAIFFIHIAMILLW